ncbi:hypothetical protein HanPI659440_Chr14g0554301 [Helianthus annuus]|nr:hypothetical protein HanPI659440_Chr14g0554301 [Helianthus annuus]
MIRKQRKRFLDNRSELVINEQEFTLVVLDDNGDGTCVQTGVDCVYDCAGHGDGEMKLVYSGDVGSEDRNDVAFADGETGDG